MNTFRQSIFAFAVLSIETSAGYKLEEFIKCWESSQVPYIIMENQFTFKQEVYIKLQLAIIEKISCLRWVNLNEVPLNPKQYVRFIRTEYTNKGCSVNPEPLTADGVREIVVTLFDYCFKHHHVGHEIMHALAFDHEHQRADRNCYVNVNQKSAKRNDLGNQFVIKPQSAWLERFPYDKYSITHYSTSSYMWDKAKSYKILAPAPLGNPEGFVTFLDWWKLVYKYCDAPHFCDVYPLLCWFMDDVEKSSKCRSPYSQES